MNTRFVAGGISGAGLIFALFFLKESNPVILAKQRGETVEQKKEEKKPRVKVHLTLTMVLCFVFEFCVRWGVNIYTARYGIYLNDKFGTPSSVLSFSLFSPFTSRTVVVCGALWNVFEQLVLYPLVVTKLNTPLPWVSFIGLLVDACGQVLMASNNQYVSMFSTLVLWIGYCFGSPTSASILSVVVC